MDNIKRELAREFRREMTPQEMRLWQQVRRNQLGGLHFRRQQPLFGFIADFYCHAARLVVEVDGSVHEQQADYDAERDAILSYHGIAVIRFLNIEVETELHATLARILSIARGRMQITEDQPI